MTKASHLPLEPAWDQPSSWPGSKTMPTALATVITVPCTSTGGLHAKGQQSDKMHFWYCLITFDCVCGYADISLPCMPVPCCVPLPRADANLALPALIVEPPCHGSGPSWSFGFLCFLLSNGGLNATYRAISKPLQCLPLIDSLIETSLICAGWRNVKEHQRA